MLKKVLTVTLPGLSNLLVGSIFMVVSNFLLFTTAIFIGVPMSAQAQSTQTQPSCCSSTTQFAALATKSDFRNAHQMPKEYTHVSAAGTSETIPALGQDNTSFYKIQATGNSNAFISVFHEWWGLNDNIKKEADRIYSALDGKATVISVDLYDGVVATDPTQAGKAMQGVTEKRARAVIGSIIDYCGPNAKIGTIGWCMGGGWSLQASLIAHSKARACVMYYGMPETDVDILKTLNAPVLGIFASQDAWITPEVVKTFERDVNSLQSIL
ncbi:MAG: dienelactone hydrolase family protein [Ignavibacteria bacterium]|nr:dienelactone hydrolase family protein [Ignavibacteria bacterium]